MYNISIATPEYSAELWIFFWIVQINETFSTGKITRTKLKIKSKFNSNKEQKKKTFATMSLAMQKRNNVSLQSQALCVRSEGKDFEWFASIN